MPVKDAVVRLQPADLAAMARRCNTFLTPDGAQAWYANDVAKLLEELALLRQEYGEARDAFEDPSEDPLPVVAKRWQETSTGLWEKAQVKKLRQEISRRQEMLDEASAQAIEAQADARAQREKQARLKAELSELAEKYAAEVQCRNELIEQHSTAMVQLEGRFEACEREVQRLQGLAERNTAMVIAQATELRASVREALQRALELVS